MPRSRLIAVGNNAAAFTDILATVPLTLLEISEDASVASMGIQIKTMLDGFVAVFVFAAGFGGITLPNAIHFAGARGPLLGVPAQNAGQFNAVAATKLVSVRSNGAAGTTLQIIENE